LVGLSDLKDQNLTFSKAHIDAISPKATLRQAQGDNHSDSAWFTTRTTIINTFSNHYVFKEQSDFEAVRTACHPKLVEGLL
jgi:hypothetical protein